MSPEVNRFVGFLLLAVVGGASAVVLLPRLLGVAAGPEAELISRLKKTEKEGYGLTVPGHAEELVSIRHEYQRLSVELDRGADAKVADVAGTLDFEGKFGNTRVHSLGLERVPFAFEDGDWEAKAGLAPRLVAVVAALEKRRAELDKGPISDPAALGILESQKAALLALRDRRYFAQDWFIRLEPDGARVTEDFRATGSLPDRPVDEKGRTELSLTRRGEEFLFLQKGE